MNGYGHKISLQFFGKWNSSRQHFCWGKKMTDKHLAVITNAMMISDLVFCYTFLCSWDFWIMPQHFSLTVVVVKQQSLAFAIRHSPFVFSLSQWANCFVDFHLSCVRSNLPPLIILSVDVCVPFDMNSYSSAAYIRTCKNKNMCRHWHA